MIATFSRTGVEFSACAMAGNAVATTVESSICINSAHPTMKGIIRAARAVSGAEEGGEVVLVDSGGMSTEGGGAS
ncbi:hypothetical protein GCM10027565_52290 [Bordetella tumulicola]